MSNDPMFHIKHYGKQLREYGSSVFHNTTLRILRLCRKISTDFAAGECRNASVSRETGHS